MVSAISSLFSRGASAVDPSKELQEAIQTGNIACLSELGVKDNLGKPLPNGQLPLHFAVLSKQPGVVDFFLKQGADSFAKDHQGLSAVDHAVLMEDGALAVALVRGGSESGLEEASKQIVSGNASKSLEQLRSDRARLLEEAVSNGFLKAILDGNLAEVKQLLDNGQLPTQLVTSDNLSLLHIAAMGSSKEVFELLLEKGADPKHTDKSKRTPLHYAVDKPLFTVVSKSLGREALLQADSSGTTPVSLIGAIAHNNDPLNLSAAQAIMFVTILIDFVVRITPESYLSESVASAYAISLLVTQFAELAILCSTIQKGWKQGIAKLLFYFTRGLPVLGMPYRIWATYAVGSTALQGIKACWNNMTQRTGAAMRNLVVHVTNSAVAAQALAKEWDITSKIFGVLKDCGAFGDGEWFGWDECGAEFVRQAQNGFQDAGSSENARKERNEYPEEGYDWQKDYSAMTPLERATDKSLDPKTLGGAKKMLFGDGEADLSKDGIARAWKDWLLKHHPDKCSEDLKPQCEEGAANINQARDTLLESV